MAKKRALRARRGNGRDSMNGLLHQIVDRLVSIERTFGEHLEHLETSVNERFDRLIALIAPRLKNHEERITKLEDKVGA